MSELTPRSRVAQLMELPPGQLKKVLTDDVLAVLAKYGVQIE